VTTPRQKCIAVFPPHPQDEKALVRLWYGFGKLSGLSKHRIDREGFGKALVRLWQTRWFIKQLSCQRRLWQTQWFIKTHK
jgi:hypothetical protein